MATTKHNPQDRVRRVCMASNTFATLDRGDTAGVCLTPGWDELNQDAFIVDGYVDEDYLFCQELADNEDVDRALRELVEDTTADNGVRVVEAVIRALKNYGAD